MRTALPPAEGFYRCPTLQIVIGISQARFSVFESGHQSGSEPIVRSLTAIA
jgi:hypothetical protein